MLNFFKFFALFAIIVFGVAVHSSAAQAQLFQPVNVKYMVIDPTSKTGYADKAIWTINSENDWARFYNQMLALPKDTAKNPDPLENKVTSMVVMSQKDRNGLTGTDIYVSDLGIMAIKTVAENRIYEDVNGFFKFLSTEQKEKAPFETAGKTKVSNLSSGIVINYNINVDLPNPAWLVQSPDEIKLYNSYLLGIKKRQLVGSTQADAIDVFDDMGSFVLYLNYPTSPAEIATISANSIRLSNLKVSVKFYRDTKKFFTYFKSQAKEVMDFKQQYQPIEVNSDTVKKF